MLNVYHSLAHLFFLFSFFSSSSASTSETVSVAAESSTLTISLPDMVITTDATPKHWAFYFHSSGVLLSFSGTSSYSICKVHIGNADRSASAV